MRIATQAARRPVEVVVVVAAVLAAGCERGELAGWQPARAARMALGTALFVSIPLALRRLKS